MDPTEDTPDFSAPCNCGALGDHASTADCVPFPVIHIEVTGSRPKCLEAIGVLRGTYEVSIETEWQDPGTGRWVFQLNAARTLRKVLLNMGLGTLTAPTPDPDTAVLACLHDSLGLEVSKEEIRALTSLSEETLSTILTTLVTTGVIEHVGPGLYRKNQ
ncbi:hypothetical protein [Streptomyces roseolus]